MRTVNRLASLLLGLVLLAGGLLLAVNGGLALAGQPPWPVRVDRWHGVLTSTPLRHPAVLAAAVGVGLLGLVLLAVQLRPWPPRQLTVTPDTAGPDTWSIHRRSVERHLADAADAVTGVDRSTVKLRGRGPRWRLLISAVGRADARAAAEDALRAELAALCAPDTIRLRLSLHHPRRVI